jgi:phosphoglycerate dehydrogenase-like enzyme
MTPRTTKVLFLNRHGDELIDYLQRGLDDPTIELQRPPSDDRADLLAMAGEADVLIGWGSDMELLEAAPNLKLFINPGTGISQHLENFRELRKTREAVLANGHGNSYAVAQHTVALLMALANKVIPHHLKMVTNQPPERPQRSVYFKDITIGLLGYGAINTKVHRFLSGFDVSFAACRRSWTGDDGPHPTAVEKFTGEQLGDFFTACDVVINALPANRFTREMVTMREFERLGEGGLFVNVGRGATVAQEDLYRALKQRIIGGAAIEVWWKRPPEPIDGRRDPYQFPFHELDNLVMSPHRGADSGGDLGRWDEVVENLKRVHAGRTDYLNVVDIDLEY